MSKQVYIVDGLRTAIGNFGGTLSTIRPDDMAAHVIKNLIAKHPNFDPKQIEDILFGCANQAGEDNRNVARMAGLLSGLPIEIGGETINRLCASGMAATINAARSIKDGAGEVYISGGVENMTRGPWVISKASTPFGRDSEMHDSSFGWRFINPQMTELYGTDGMGNTAENLAEMYSIDRESQDSFAAWSQEKTSKAQALGRFEEEIIAVNIPQRKKEDIIFTKDEFARNGTTMESLGGLRPAFKKEGGTVTAGNASGLNDGAAALLIASEDAVKSNNFKPLARIVAGAVAGVEPRIMGIGPVFAAEKALKRSGLTLGQMDIIEVNEAFAAQTLSNVKMFASDKFAKEKLGRDKAIGDIDMDKFNVMGSSLAYGHPFAATGTRMITQMLNELNRRGGGTGLLTACAAGGLGAAMIVETE